MNIASLQEVVDESDVIFLAIMEDITENVLRSISFSKDQTIISFILGVNLQTLQTLCAPARDIAITIPLPMIENGKCPLPVYPANKKLLELFGSDNKNGSITYGFLEKAANGTLLIDEVSEIPLETQAKILRVLIDQKFKRLNGKKDINVNICLLYTSPSPRDS